jgi:hypothetical protein
MFNAISVRTYLEAIQTIVDTLTVYVLDSKKWCGPGALSVPSFEITNDMALLTEVLGAGLVIVYFRQVGGATKSCDL